MSIRTIDTLLLRVREDLQEGWITVNGAHIEIGDNGEVTKGPPELIGKDSKDLSKGTSSSEPKTSPNGDSKGKEDRGLPKKSRSELLSLDSDIDHQMRNVNRGKNSAKDYEKAVQVKGALALSYQEEAEKFRADNPPNAKLPEKIYKPLDKYRTQTRELSRDASWAARAEDTKEAHLSAWHTNYNAVKSGSLTAGEGNPRVAEHAAHVKSHQAFTSDKVEHHKEAIDRNTAVLSRFRSLQQRSAEDSDHYEKIYKDLADKHEKLISRHKEAIKGR